MAVSVDNRPTRMRLALAAVLTVLTLIPAGYLFSQVWQNNDDARHDTALEQQGVEYLTTMAPLVSALAEAETAALQGVSAAPASLTAAAASVTAVDLRLGDALQTHDRWAGLRDRIGRLPGVTGDAQAVFQAHVETTDLALALFDTVRDNSTLIRDPDNDLSHLQQAVAADLPNTVVQVNRIGDLARMLAGLAGTPTQPTAQQAALGSQLGAAVDQVQAAVEDLSDDLQAAVDDTNSPTLSGNLVTSLDAFRRGVESLTKGANPGGAPAPAAMATAQNQLQNALAGLAGITLKEMGTLLTDRLDTLDSRRIEALVAATAVVMLVLVAAFLGLTGGRRRYEPAAGEPVGRLLFGRNRPEPGYGSPIDPPPSYGDGNPTRRERSGALR
jgi:hypothetical protein